MLVIRKCRGVVSSQNYFLVSFFVFCLGLFTYGCTELKTKGGESSTPAEVILALQGVADEKLIRVYVDFTNAGKVYRVERSIIALEVDQGKSDKEKAKALRHLICEVLISSFSTKEIEQILAVLVSSEQKEERLFWLKTLLFITEGRYVVI